MYGRSDVDAAAMGVELDDDIGFNAPAKNDLLSSVGAVTGSGRKGRSDEDRKSLIKAYGGSPPAEETAPSRTRSPEPWESRFANPSPTQKPIEADKKRSRPSSDAESLMMQVTPRIVIQEEESENLGLESLDIAPSFHRPDPRSASEQYELPPENPFRNVHEAPLSTFSIDVDTASYANVRRFLNSGRLPPPAAVRIEELLNYFSYSYPQPKGEEPFSVNLESAECPWRPGHLLLRVGLKGKEVHRAERPSSNLVFLVDVSGSMADENKLPLLKTSLAMMATHLTASDRVSIVVYAGEAGTKLDSARGNEQDKILNVIQSLGAGGSTHGSAGIQVAYDLAKKNFIAGGVNRVIWATDGDLNVGVTDDGSLVTLIKEKAASGVFLTVLGVGEGNLKDAKLEKLADNGNGMYAYLDTIKEAHKVLIEQMSGSLVTIAKDVKLQIEFNPAEVAAYRLIGYENRMLAARDFHDDKKDAGEIGAGHTVTALYELIPAGLKSDQASPPEGELKYQKPAKAAVEEKPAPGQLSDAAKSGELLTLKLRYKQPDAERSVLREFPLKERGGRFSGASRDFQFASAVAQFGMLLRGSEHRGGSSWSAVAETAAASAGDDSQSVRAEFVELIRKAETLQPQ
jgi:Ca-activated chloride channel family protein